MIVFGLTLLGWGFVGMMGLFLAASGIVALGEHKSDIAGFFSDVFNTIFHPIRRMREIALNRDMKKHPEKYVGKKYYWELYGLKKDIELKKWHIQLDKHHKREYTKDLKQVNKKISRITKEQGILNAKILKTVDNEKSQLLASRLNELAAKKEKFESFKENRESLIKGSDESLERNTERLNNLKTQKTVINESIRAEQEAIIAERTNKTVKNPVKTKIDRDELSM